MTELTEEEIYKKKNTVNQKYIDKNVSFPEKHIIVDADMKIFEINKELKSTAEKNKLLENEIIVLKNKNSKLYNDNMDNIYKNKHKIINLQSNYTSAVEKNKELVHIVEENNFFKTKYTDLKNIYDKLYKTHNDMCKKYNDALEILEKIEKNYHTEINNNKILSFTVERLNTSNNILVEKKSEIYGLINILYTEKI